VKEGDRLAAYRMRSLRTLHDGLGDVV
jgi:hypothetical protein